MFGVIDVLGVDAPGLDLAGLPDVVLVAVFAEVVLPDRQNLFAAIEITIAVSITGVLRNVASAFSERIALQVNLIRWTSASPSGLAFTIVTVSLDGVCGS